MGTVWVAYGCILAGRERLTHGCERGRSADPGFRARIAPRSGSCSRRSGWVSADAGRRSRIAAGRVAAGSAHRDFRKGWGRLPSRGGRWSRCADGHRAADGDDGSFPQDGGGPVGFRRKVWRQTKQRAGLRIRSGVTRLSGAKALRRGSGIGLPRSSVRRVSGGAFDRQGATRRPRWRVRADRRRDGADRRFGGADGTPG